MASSSGLCRAAVAFALIASVASAQEQEPPFRVETPFGPGETWRLRTEVTTMEQPVQQGEDEAEVSTVVWTESAAVEARPAGFALRSTLTSWRMESRAPNAESRMVYDAEDLSTIRVGGREVDFAHTWVFEFDPSWRLLGVAGQRETLEQLYERAVADMDGWGKWLGSTLGPYVVDLMSARLEEQLIRSNDDGGTPVRVVMERLRAAGRLEPGFEKRFDAVGDLPAGTVRFVGVGDAGAELEVEFDVQQTADGSVTEYAFAIDDAGRLTRLVAIGTKVVTKGDQDVRVTSRYAYTLEQVIQADATSVPTREQEPAQPRPY